ncbi:MAG: hypothetical protein AVDCRST_MAG27-2591 [uncultured Craurococcus sp.]|uniref:DUF6894 domain-containing protein n=1 Tax=uncultured Craurococcus sp. TaxID=1135998 RepID=A0A6J4IUZ7_9PROT|nr:MAG: hypothetical protein AVDCRST_MAG27-2591 [uncultured Craurococcus sp.]
MPRFFFHMRDEDWLVEDPEGSELPDLEAARAKAAEVALDYLVGRLRAGEALDFERVEIWDGAGRMLGTVPFPDAPDPR